MEFFSNFEQFFEQSETSRYFDKKSFIASFPKAVRNFTEEFCNTQLFEGLLLTLEREAKGEEAKNDAERETWKLMKLVKECGDLLKERDLRDGILAVREHLVPRNWKLKCVKLPEIESKVDDHLLEQIANRNPTEFPRLCKELLNEPISRFEFS